MKIEEAITTKGIYESLYNNTQNGLRILTNLVVGNGVSKGFRPQFPDMDRENIAVFVANLHGEVSELWEAFRKGEIHKPCKKAKEMGAMGLPALTCAEEEIADIIIRALDTAQAFGINAAQAVAAKHAYNTTRPHRHGGKLA